MEVKHAIIKAMKQTNEIIGERWTSFENDTGIMNHETGDVMDSVDFVGFIMLLEDMIKEETGHSIKLMSSKVFSQAESPFKTVTTLDKYIQELLNEKI